MVYIPRPLATPIHAIAKQALGKDWQLYGILLTHWRDIVGESWADMATPVKLNFPTIPQNQGQNGKQRLQNGVLTIRLPRGLALEAQYQHSRIIDRINNFFGSATISRLIFTHATDPAPLAASPPAPLSAEARKKIAAKLAPVSAPEIRDALQNLAESMEKSRG